MRRKAHAGCGERPWETGREQSRHRAHGLLDGFHPLWAFVDHGQDGTGEPAAVLLRAGNAGSVRHEVARVEWLHRLGVRLMSTV